MNTTEFFDFVLPTAGLRCIAVPVPGGGFRHSYKRSNSLAAQLASNADQRGLTVYFGCASFLTGESRKAANVEAVRSFWLDLDCGTGKAYADQPAALDALAAFVEALRLPAPLLVSSGRGVHAYWPMDADMTPEAWRAVATSLKEACAVFGLHADPSRTADIASVLRPVGTHHRKAAPVPVTVLQVGSQTPLAEFAGRLKTFLGERPDRPGLREQAFPVAKVERTAGRPTRKIKDSLTGVVVWSARDASEQKVFWPMRQTFNWNGLVMMRPDPRSPHRVEFKTLQLDGDAVQVQRLIAVKAGTPSLSAVPPGGLSVQDTLPRSDPYRPNPSRA